MKATLRIDMSNDAFDNFPGDELARILRDAANDVVGCDDAYLRGASIRLMDSNGNTVGKLTITGR